MDETRIGAGNFDWIVAEDDEGNYWVRPAIRWQDGEVYESFESGKWLYRMWMQEIDD